MQKTRKMQSRLRRRYGPAYRAYRSGKMKRAERLFLSWEWRINARSGYHCAQRIIIHHLPKAIIIKYGSYMLNCANKNGRSANRPYEYGAYYKRRVRTRRFSSIILRIFSARLKWISAVWWLLSSCFSPIWSDTRKTSPLWAILNGPSKSVITR